MSDPRLGKHLHALEGSWLAHPSWRTKFVLADAADLHAVIGSGVRECWIDPTKGLDIASAAVDAVPATVMDSPTADEASPHALPDAPADGPTNAPTDAVPEPSASFEAEME